MKKNESEIEIREGDKENKKRDDVNTAAMQK